VKKTKKLMIMGCVAAGFATADNLIKSLIDKDRIKDGPIDKNGFFEIEKHHNKGIPMNKLDKHTKEIAAASVFVLGAHAANTVSRAINEDNCIMDAANTLIMAGALSNTCDRVKKGYVTDYLMVGKKKRAIYNISDFFIFGGALLTAICVLKDSMVEGTKRLISALKKA